MRTFSRKTSALVLASALAVAGAACSDDEDPADDPTDETSVPAGDDTSEPVGGTTSESEMDMGSESEMEPGTTESES